MVVKACGGGCGGAVAYRCRESQVAHWKEGHKAACGKGLTAAAAGTGAGRAPQ